MTDATLPDHKLDTSALNGTRKLVRPHLPRAERRREAPGAPDPLSHALLERDGPFPESSHAEAFYFQKQIQQGTELTLVLDSGEELRGVLQWYDRAVVKIRVGRNRVLVYKSCIKYLYKSSDAHPGTGIMK